MTNLHTVNIKPLCIAIRNSKQNMCPSALCVHSMSLRVYCINPFVHKTISTIYYLCDQCDEENGCNSGILGYWFCLFAVSHTARGCHIHDGGYTKYRLYKELCVYRIRLLRHKVIHCILIIYYIICIIAVGCAVLGEKLTIPHFSMDFLGV